MRSVSVAPGAVNRSTTPYAKFCSDAVTGLPSMGARPPLPPVLPAVGWRASSDVLTCLQGPQWTFCRLLLRHEPFAVARKHLRASLYMYVPPLCPSRPAGRHLPATFHRQPTLHTVPPPPQHCASGPELTPALSAGPPPGYASPLHSAHRRLHLLGRRQWSGAAFPCTEWPAAAPWPSGPQGRRWRT